ncbi:hypothetical protein [Streptomyces sp. SLBN-118]|uniref:hypothetical protein n=1 Tax=Streptomyces sp. SLBN-118 TaxID=2768454 RepID=UPI0011546D2F|nr:hypothetical protein [Streptomyces sp. SLBN-118]
MTLVPALVAEREIWLAEAAPWHPDRSAVEVFCQWAKPLIEITAPGAYGRSNLYRALDLGDADPRLREFLCADQVGARKVARHIFDIVGLMARGCSPLRWVRRRSTRVPRASSAKRPICVDTSPCRTSSTLSEDCAQSCRTT